MSPRKTILRELTRAGPATFMRPSQIPGFASRAAGYREAVNALLKDQLITGARDEEGKLVVGVNGQNVSRVRKELRPWFATPIVWGAALGLAVLATVTLFV